MTSRPTALITGASGGIGLELARAAATDQHDLILVARSEEKLQRVADELGEAHRVDAQVEVADLADPDAPRRLFERVTAGGRTVDVLVNNAGFATYGPLVKQDYQTEMDQIQVNVAALTALTKLFLPGMLERRQGRIMNMASTAAFQPGPLMAVYYATKTYVLFFSEALAEELRDSGVTVTALCPGPTASGFQARADMDSSRLVQGGLMTAAEVAAKGWQAMKAGKTVVVPGFRNRVGSLLPRFLPRRLTARVVKIAQSEV